MAFLDFNSTYQLLVCRPCRYAVDPAEILYHLREKHPDLSPAARGVVQQQVARWPTVAPAQIVFPHHAVPYIPSLPYLADGLQCIRCQPPRRYLCTSHAAMKKHCRQAHGWINPYSRGGSRHYRQHRDYPWRTGIPCQRFFTHGAYQQYFEVIPPPQPSLLSEPCPSPHVDQPGTAIQAQLAAFDAAAAASATVVGPEEPADFHPWLQRTRWIPYLQGMNREAVQPLVELPGPEEPVLLAVAASLHRILQRARETVLTERINIFDQTAINMFRDHATKAGQPLLVSLQQGTYDRYGGVWVRFLSFLHRIGQAQIDPTVRQQLRIQLRPEQEERYNSCLDRARTFGTETDNEEVELELDRAVTGWSLSLLCHPLHSDRHASGLVSFLAVLGLKPVSSFHPRFISELISIDWGSLG